MSKLFPKYPNEGSVPVLVCSNNYEIVDTYMIELFKKHKLDFITMFNTDLNENMNIPIAFLDQSFFVEHTLFTPTCLICFIEVDDSKPVPYFIEVVTKFISGASQFSCQSMFVFIQTHDNKLVGQLSAKYKKVVSDNIVRNVFFDCGKNKEHIEMVQQFVLQQYRFSLTKFQQVPPAKTAHGQTIQLIKALNAMVPMKQLPAARTMITELINKLLTNPQVAPKLGLPLRLSYAQAVGAFHQFTYDRYYLKLRDPIEHYTEADYMFTNVTLLPAVQFMQEVAIISPESSNKLAVEQLFSSLVKETATPFQIILYLFNLLILTGAEPKQIFQIYRYVIDNFSGINRDVMAYCWADYILQHNKDRNVAFHKLGALIDLKNFDGRWDELSREAAAQISVMINHQQQEQNDPEFTPRQLRLVQQSQMVKNWYIRNMDVHVAQQGFNIFLHPELTAVLATGQAFVAEIKNTVNLSLSNMIQLPDFLVLNYITNQLIKQYHIFDSTAAYAVKVILQVIQSTNSGKLQQNVVKHIIKQLYLLTLQQTLEQNLHNEIIMMYYAITGDKNTNFAQITGDIEQTVEMVNKSSYTFQSPELDDLEFYSIDRKIIQYSSTGRQQKLKFFLQADGFKFCKVVFKNSDNEPQSIHIRKMLQGENIIEYNIRHQAKVDEDQHFYLSEIQMSHDQKHWFCIHSVKLSLQQIANYEQQLKILCANEKQVADVQQSPDIIINVVPFEHRCDVTLANPCVYSNCEQNLIFQVKLAHPVQLLINVHEKNLRLLSDIEFIDTKQVVKCQQGHQLSYSASKHFLIKIHCMVPEAVEHLLEFVFDNRLSVITQVVTIKPEPLIEALFCLQWKKVCFNIRNISQKYLDNVKLHITINGTGTEKMIDNLSETEETGLSFNLVSNQIDVAAELFVTVPTPTTNILLFSQSQKEIKERESIDKDSLTASLKTDSFERRDSYQFEDDHQNLDQFAFEEIQKVTFVFSLKGTAGFQKQLELVPKMRVNQVYKLKYELFSDLAIKMSLADHGFGVDGVSEIILNGQTVIDLQIIPVVSGIFQLPQFEGGTLTCVGVTEAKLLQCQVVI